MAETIRYEPASDKTGEGEYLRFWYESGAQKYRMSKVGDELEGEFESWFESGEPWARGRYVNGRRDGEWICHNDPGGRALVLTYENGVIVSPREIDPANACGCSARNTAPGSCPQDIAAAP